MAFLDRVRAHGLDFKVYGVGAQSSQLSLLM